MFRGIAHEYPGHLMACSVTLACAGCAAFFLFRSRCIPLFTPSHYETLFRSASFFSRLSASISFRPTTFLVLLDRLRYVGSSLPAEIRAFLPLVPLLFLFDCSRVQFARGSRETRRLSISIRSSRRPLCNLSADDVTTSAPKRD